MYVGWMVRGGHAYVAVGLKESLSGGGRGVKAATHLLAVRSHFKTSVRIIGTSAVCLFVCVVCYVSEDCVKR